MKYRCIYKKIAAWLNLRKPVFVIDVVVGITIIVLRLINYSKCIELLYNPVVFAFLMLLVILHIYPMLLNALIAKHCNQTVADQVIPYNTDIEKIKKEIKDANLQKEKNHQEIQLFIKHEEIDDIKNLVNDFKNKKYKKVILRARQHIANTVDIRYNILLEFAYSCQKTSEYKMQDRIANLAIIIKQDKPISMKINFILAYIACNLFAENHSIVERAVYKALDLVLKSKLDPKYLTILYKMQMDNFILQNRIAEGIASGNKALEYSDEKESCKIYLELAKIYFYFLGDNKASLDNALLAWEHIYKDAPFTKDLVQLCYITLFIDNQIDTACDFLLNFTANDKDDSYKDNLSYLLYKRGDKKNALNNANYCIQQNRKESVASINTLGMIEKDEEHFEKAIYYFSEAIPGLEPNNQLKIMKCFWLEAIYNRAVCYIKLSNFEKAKADMEVVIKENYTGIDAEILKEYYDLSPDHIVE